VNITELSKALTDTDDYYNAVYSPAELNTDEYLSVINVDDIIEQAGNMNSFMNFFVWIMIGTSVLIGAIIIYILTVMTIADNFFNISLFKVLGYNQGEINKMILGGYSLYGFIAFIATIPISIYAFQIMKQFLARGHRSINLFPNIPSRRIFSEEASGEDFLARSDENV